MSVFIYSFIVIIIIIILLLMIFSHQHLWVIFDWSPNDRKSPKASRTLLNILADLNNVVVWMVLIFPLIFYCSSPLSKLLEIVTSPLTTMGITVILICHSFLVL